LRRKLILSLLSVLVLAALVGGIAHFAYGFPSSLSASAVRPIGANVSVIGNAPEDIKAVVTQDSAPFKMSPLGPVVDITPSGIIHGAPITLRFKLNKRVSDGEVLIAVRATPGGEWTLMKPTVSADGMYASVVTDHLSWWEPYWYDIKEAVSELHNFFNTISTDLFTTAQKPTCANESAALGYGYTIDSSAKNTLYLCFGIEDGSRVLKVVNRKPYSLELTHPGLTVKHIDNFNLDFDQLARWGSGQTSVLYPFEEEDFNVDVPPGKQAGVFAEYAGFANSLNQLQVGVEALASVLSRFGAIDKDIGFKDLVTPKGLKLVLNWMQALLLDARGCANAMFPPDPAKVFSGCLQPQNIVEAFGWKGLLLTMFMAAGSVAEYFRNSIVAFVDIASEKDKYGIIVSRSNLQATLSTYVGTWYALQGYSITVKADSTGEDFLDDAYKAPGILCAEYDSIAFTLMEDGSLTGIITSTRYEPTGGQCSQAPSMVGEKLTLRHSGPHRLCLTQPEPYSGYLIPLYDSYSLTGDPYQCVV
jgi:hypothetical protein